MSRWTTSSFFFIARSLDTPPWNRISTRSGEVAGIVPIDWERLRIDWVSLDAAMAQRRIPPVELLPSARNGDRTLAVDGGPPRLSGMMAATTT
jgi:hypothetical protein